MFLKKGLFIKNISIFFKFNLYFLFKIKSLFIKRAHRLPYKGRVPFALYLLICSPLAL